MYMVLYLVRQVITKLPEVLAAGKNVYAWERLKKQGPEREIEKSLLTVTCLPVVFYMVVCFWLT